MLSPQSARQRSRLADSSPGGTLVKQEMSDTYTPGEVKSLYQWHEQASLTTFVRQNLHAALAGHLQAEAWHCS